MTKISQKMQGHHMQGQKHILVVDNDASRRHQIETVLAFVGEHFYVFSEAEIDQHLADIANVLTIILCGDISSKLQEVIKSHPTYPFIYHDIIDKKQLNGYVNVIGELTTPLNYAQLTELVHHSHQYHNNLPSKRGNNGPSSLFRSLVGSSEPMQQVRFLIEQVASTAANVLILGESGTGKEVVARNIHNLSDRSKGPFVPVNCGAIPAELLESELFGHEKGAFTGAISTRKGRFEMAEGGTLFLDEIGDMPSDTQTRLLRVLADGEFYRVGGTAPVKVNVRIIAATHQNLETLVKEGRFREDLFHRLNVIRIHLPRLADRREDIPKLLTHFLKRAAEELEVEVKQLRTETEEFLSSLDWPGNVRQLENTCRWITVMASGREVLVSDLPPELLDQQTSVATSGNWEQSLRYWADQQLGNGTDHLLDTAVPIFERIMIETALKHTAGRRRDAANLLGWGRNTLTRKIKELNMDSGSDDEDSDD
jgi:nitrogen regulation protein NR(I)